MLFFFGSSCKKSVFNYRHKYIGKWSFTTIDNFWCASPNLCTIDTLVYQGVISYGDNDNEISVNNYSNCSYVFEVDKRGQLSYPNQTNPVGNISNKTVNFVLEFDTPGSSQKFEINGKKK